MFDGYGETSRFGEEPFFGHTEMGVDLSPQKLVFSSLMEYFQISLLDISRNIVYIYIYIYMILQTDSTVLYSTLLIFPKNGYWSNALLGLCENYQ